MDANTAEKIESQFYVSHRPDGSAYITANEGTEARDLVRHVHFSAFGGMFPDDWVYEKTRALLECIADGADPDTDYPLDLSTYTLVTWAASNTWWLSYVEEAMQETHYTNLSDACAAGQVLALAAILAAIASWSPDESIVTA